MSRILTASVLIAILVLAGGVIFHSQNTPEYALTQVGEAIERRDAVLLEKHVDIDAVLSAAVDDMIALEAAADTVCHADSRAHTKDELAALARDAVLSAFLTDSITLGAVDIESVQRDGRTAHASVRVERPLPDTALVLELVLEKRRAGWTLIEVTNAPDCILPAGR